jgi:ABC-type sugar transport system substrate-binding protein
MKRLYTFLLAAVMVLSLAACGGQASSSSSGSDASSGDSAAEMPTVGFVSASWTDDYCKRLSDALVELGPEYGLNVDAINGAPSGSPDVSGYIEAIDALASKNPDAMIVQPLFSVPDHCVQFNEKGIPLTFLNIAPEISENCKDLEYYYAGCFDTKIGEQLAQEMEKGLKEGAKICVMCLTYGQTNAAQRLDGFQTWMTANRPDVEILEVQYVQKNDPTDAQRIFEDWIQKYGVGGFDGVATQSSMQTQGIVSSMKSYGLNTENFILAGISASTGEWVAEGSEFVDLYQDPYAEARAALEVTRAQLDGTTDQLELLDGEYNCVAVAMTPITIENADQFT